MKIYYTLNYRKIKRWLRKIIPVIFFMALFYGIFAIVGTQEYKHQIYDSTQEQIVQTLNGGR